MFEFLTGKEIKLDDDLPKKLWKPCYRKVNIKEFRFVAGITLFTGIIDRGVSCEKSPQVGESSSSQQAKKRKSLLIIQQHSNLCIKLLFINNILFFTKFIQLNIH